MQIRINNQPVMAVVPKYENQELVIAIDSSKTNSAFTVGDMSHRVLDYYEFNGSDVGTATTDTLKMCQEQRKLLSIIFCNSKPKIVGIEDIITKTKPGERTGMTEHMSRFKITAVFMSFIAFFQDEFSITPELVNNWTWKTTVLPEQYCSRKYAKGSLQYYKDINSPYQYCTDDVTDSLCIFEYLCRIHNINTKLKITSTEVSRYEHSAVLVSCERKLSRTTVLFEYNKDLTLKQNAAVMSNRLDNKSVGVAEVPVTWLSWEEIYMYCKEQFKPCENVIKLVVLRKG